MRWLLRWHKQRKAAWQAMTKLEQRRRRVRRKNRARRFGMITLFIAGALALLVGLPWLVWRGPYVFDAKYIDRKALASGSAALVTGLRTAVVAFTAALGAGIALLYTARTYRLTHRGQITDRFTKALERLGSPEIYVRIGGILALEQIVQDAPEQAATDAARVLGHFIRHRAPRAAPWPDTNTPGTGPGPGPLPEEPAADVQAALTALTQTQSRTHVDPREPLNLHGLHLAGANLNQADLTQANLSGATLTGANLYEATLTGASLDEAMLLNASLYAATLTGADLYTATLTGADLRAATLTGADLRAATLIGANLRAATLTDANLSTAEMTGANLQAATLTRAKLELATLTGADLHAATLTRADLTEANLHGATLTGADLHAATLNWANLRGATLTRADLTGADLHGATLTDARLLHTDLSTSRSFTAGQATSAITDQSTIMPSHLYVSVGSGA
ncbi:pentapeptide repeat-containing protein [Streptomyces sioyaensis]|uniref:pentapeptide repeat-containing protein n=1 Tax=Streptomyces sioyaensis TaxID=67364 RepID=UPI0036EC81FF